MNKLLLALVMSSMSLVSTSAFAQTPPPAALQTPAIPPGEAQAAPVPPPPADNGAVPDLQAPPPSADSAPSPGPSVEDRLGTVEGKVEGIDESLAAANSTVGSLAKLKVSGYIQGRYENRETSVNGLTSAGRPATTDQFLVRRARLKSTYAGTNSEFVLQLDATGAGVTLKDAEATFVDTWSPLGLRLTVGQFKWSFGYEVLQSSGEREMPERSSVIRALFNGERDRGVRIQGRYEWLRFAAALVNGTGTGDAIYGNNDSNAFKDLVGRVGGDFDWLVVGVSGYFGRSLKTTLPVAFTSTGSDRNMDGTITADEVTFTAAKPATYQRFSVLRVGTDAQVYFDIPSVGGLALKGEFIFSKDSHLSFGTMAANSCLDVTRVGWILTAVQNIGDNVGVVARFDSYDPNFSKALDSSCTAAQITAGQGDRVDTLGGGLLLHGSGNIKATFVYEHVFEQSTPLKNDIFTAQLQAKF